MGICGTKNVQSNKARVIQKQMTLPENIKDFKTNGSENNRNSLQTHGTTEKDEKIHSEVILQKVESENKPRKRMYVKGDLIDSGAYAQVFSGLDMDTGQQLAIKTIKLSGNLCKVRAQIKGLKEEIRLIKKLKHKNIVQYMYTEIHEDMSAVDIVLEYIPGGSLRQLLNHVGKLDENIVRVYTRQILEGLDYLHQNGIIHRDIKCANILIDTTGVIKLADFGTSKKITTQDFLDPSLNLSLKGSPYWMSPEVINRKGHTFKADIWSVGGCVIEMLTGKPPYADEIKDFKQVLKAISQGIIPKFPECNSQSTVNFLEQIYVVEDQKRPSAKNLLNHHFITHPNNSRSESQTAQLIEYQKERMKLKQQYDQSIRRKISQKHNEDEELQIIEESQQNIKIVRLSHDISKEDQIINFEKQKQFENLLEKKKRQKAWEAALKQELLEKNQFEHKQTTFIQQVQL